MSVRTLVLGSGGREHALTWALQKSGAEVLCAPGNGGIESSTRCFAVSPEDGPAVIDLVRRERIDYVVIGPEAPLAAGISDQLASERIPVVGPSRAAAQLESSKVFSKLFMSRHGVPTAPFTVHTTPETALSVLNSAETSFPIVVKADGLAAGKGVIVARDKEEAVEAVHRILSAREFGSAGDQLILEGFLRGKEASFIVFTDGETIVPAVAARDHKAVYDNDSGPNTGGMGAFSNDAILGPALQHEVMERVIRPVVNGMREEGSPFSGMLYAGLMLTESGPQVLEFNVRMGDPEAQVILPRLKSSAVDLFGAVAHGRLKDTEVTWKSDPSVCIVLASGGYPGNYDKGKTITGLEMAAEDPRVMIFHSGTRRDGDRIVTSGGRVLGVSAIADNLATAILSAYEATNKIHFEGMHYRRDIGRTGLV